MSDLDINKMADFSEALKQNALFSLLSGGKTKLTFEIFFSTIILYNWAIIKPEKQVDSIFCRILFTHTK